MRVTVTIPVFNTPENILDECIWSVLKQTYQDFDFIIVDDGSTAAGTLAYLQRIAKKYDGMQNRLIRVEFLEKNGGTSVALNHSFKISENEWHCVIGSDDTMEPNHLQLMVDYIKKHPEIDALGSGLKAFLNGSYKWAKKHEAKIVKPMTWYMNHTGSFVKRESVLFLGGYWENPEHATNPKASRAQDFDLWNRMFLAGMQLHNIPDFTINYRLRR